MSDWEEKPLYFPCALLGHSPPPLLFCLSSASGESWRTRTGVPPLHHQHIKWHVFKILPAGQKQKDTKRTFFHGSWYSKLLGSFRQARKIDNESILRFWKELFDSSFDGRVNKRFFESYNELIELRYELSHQNRNQMLARMIDQKLIWKQFPAVFSVLFCQRNNSIIFSVVSFDTKS